MKNWLKGPASWVKNGIMFISIPFTWNLPIIKNVLQQRSFLWSRVIVGGPAVYAMPEYFDDMEFVNIRPYWPGVLQRVNPDATKTTAGCVRKCGFCFVPEIEGAFVELDAWPDRPILIDNNLLAASQAHFDRVIDNLVKWNVVDFSQGLDVRLLNEYHARRLAEIKNPIIRLALDSVGLKDAFARSIDFLADAGVARYKIRSHVLVGYDTDPADAWGRCQYVESFGIKPAPLWYHGPRAMKKGQVSDEQKALGWDDYERRRILQWYFQHKRAVKYA